MGGTVLLVHSGHKVCVGQSSGHEIFVAQRVGQALLVDIVDRKGENGHFDWVSQI